MDHQTTVHASGPDQAPPPMGRRRFALLALGGAAVLALSACGGGGSDGNDDGGSGEPLRAVFDKLTPGLTKEEVLAMVNFTPKENSKGALVWQKGAESLHVGFDDLHGDGALTASSADWSGSGSRREHRSLTGI